MNDDSAVRLEPSANSDAQTYVNGVLITSSTQLHHVRINEIIILTIPASSINQYFKVIVIH